MPTPHPSDSPPRFYGKYRGLVVANDDPEQIGRVQVNVPDVLGLVPSGWAMPCVPVAGRQSGCFMVPPLDSQVWVEFEGGDPDYPIWTGGFWTNASEIPALALTSPAASPGQNMVWQTTGGNLLALNDAPGTVSSGGLVLKSAGGAMIVVNETGIYINNGVGAEITLLGPNVNVTGLQEGGESRR